MDSTTERRMSDMAQTQYNRDSGQLPGNEPEGTEPTVFSHGYYGAEGLAYNVPDERAGRWPIDVALTPLTVKDEEEGS
jgi:hypothetical protein